MKNKKTTSLILMTVIVLGLVAYVLYSNKNIPAVSEVPTPSNSSVVYNNTEYGFTFSLPESWKGYSIVKDTWQGSPLTSSTTKEIGPKLLLRNPKWTQDAPYEDIPILIFTVAQWDSYKSGNFAVSAAPIEAGELARNNRYVFALPPRWDFDYSKGYEEAQTILKMNPMKGYSI